jgi:uncharacterized protein (TIGR02246 family)
MLASRRDNSLAQPPTAERFDMTDDERAVREMIDLWMSATKIGDLATVLSLMTDDVVFMVPGQEPFGKEAFAARSEGMKGVEIDGCATTS